jgi:hypothetical protein
MGVNAAARMRRIYGFTVTIQLQRQSARNRNAGERPVTRLPGCKPDLGSETGFRWSQVFRFVLQRSFSGKQADNPAGSFKFRPGARVTFL